MANEDLAQLQDPLEIELNGSSRSILAEVNEAIRRIELLRPFDADTVSRLQTALLPRRIVATLNMEGISATHRQTLMVMDAMKIREVPKRGSKEISNALLANQFVVDSIDLGVEFSESVVREVNRILMQDIQSDAGEFRSVLVELIGAPYPPALPSDIPDLVNRMCEFFEQADSCDPIVQAAWLHAQFTMIHPFSDGNGRTGRLLQDFALMRRGLLPVGIPPTERDSYYAALESADKGDWNSFVEMLSSLELLTISETEAIAKEPERRSAWIQRLSEAASQKVKETNQKKYVIWKTCIESFVSELSTVVDELNNAQSPISARVRQARVPSVEVWNDLQADPEIAPIRLLSIQLSVNDNHFYQLSMYLGVHEPTEADLFESLPDLVGIYMTGADSTEGEQPKFKEFSDQTIRLREILYVGSNLYVYRSDPSGSGWECRDDFSHGEIIEELFEDIFIRKAGI